MRPVQMTKKVRRVVIIASITVSAIAIVGCSDGPSTSESESAASGSSAAAAGVTTTSLTTSVTTRSDQGSTSTASVPSVSTEPPLFEFSSSASAAGWSVVNDTVMGGVSSGLVVVNNGRLVFSGDLSLDNNGGFASVRSPAVRSEWADVWSDRSGPRIVVEGDGRTWTVEVRTDDGSGGWITTLPTSPNSITELTLPWTSFEPVGRFLEPREADGPLDPRRIVSIAFYLVDGIEGSFRLGILSIG